MNQTVAQIYGINTQNMNKNSSNAIIANQTNSNSNVDIDLDNIDEILHQIDDDSQRNALLLKIFKLVKATTDQDTIFRLLSSGASSNAMDPDGKTLLMIAAEKGYVDLIGLLLEQKADINQKDKHGKNALFYALESQAENIDIVSFLLDRNADPNCETLDRMTPFLKAVEKGFAKIAEILIEKGANIHTELETTGDTALHIAVKNKNKYLIGLLLKNNFDPLKRNKKRLNAYDLAENDKDIYNYLTQSTSKQEVNQLVNKQNQLDTQTITDTNESMIMPTDRSVFISDVENQKSVLDSKYSSSLSFTVSQKKYIIKDKLQNNNNNNQTMNINARSIKYVKKDSSDVNNNKEDNDDSIISINSSTNNNNHQYGSLSYNQTNIQSNKNINQIAQQQISPQMALPVASSQNNPNIRNNIMFSNANAGPGTANIANQSKKNGKHQQFQYQYQQQQQQQHVISKNQFNPKSGYQIQQPPMIPPFATKNSTKQQYIPNRGFTEGEIIVNNSTDFTNNNATTYQRKQIYSPSLGSNQNTNLSSSSSSSSSQLYSKGIYNQSFQESMENTKFIEDIENNNKQMMIPGKYAKGNQHQSQYNNTLPNMINSPINNSNEGDNENMLLMMNNTNQQQQQQIYMHGSLGNQSMKLNGFTIAQVNNNTANMGSSNANQSNRINSNAIENIHILKNIAINIGDVGDIQQRETITQIADMETFRKHAFDLKKLYEELKKENDLLKSENKDIKINLDKAINNENTYKQLLNEKDRIINQIKNQEKQEIQRADVSVNTIPKTISPKIDKSIMTDQSIQLAKIFLDSTLNQKYANSHNYLNFAENFFLKLIISQKYGGENNRIREFKPLEKSIDLICNTEDIANALHEEIISFEHWINQYNMDKKNLFDSLTSQIKQAVNEAIPNSECYIYGSFATGLSLPWSDIDVVIKISPYTTNSYGNQQLLEAIEAIIRKKKWSEGTKTIKNTSVPVLKITCSKEYLNKKVDISIQDMRHNGLKCVELVKEYLQIYPQLRTLVLALKYLLYILNLNDTYQGGLSSYGLILMIVYLIQRPAQKNMGADQNNLGLLLLNFLFRYGIEYDYVSNFQVLPQRPHQNNDMMNNFSMMFNFNLPSIYIQDPLNPQNNVGRSTFNILKIKTAFMAGYLAAHQCCHCEVHKYFNDMILTEDQKQGKCIKGIKTKECSSIFKKILTAYLSFENGS